MKSAAEDSSYLPMKVGGDDYLTSDSSPAYLVPQESTTHDDDDDDEDDIRQSLQPAAAAEAANDTSLVEKPLLGPASQNQTSHVKTGADYHNVP